MLTQFAKRLTAGSFLAATYAHTAFASAESGAKAAQPDGTPSDLFSASGVFKTLSNTLIFLVGAIAVIVLIIGGLRYVTSQGNSDQVKQAKDTILYGIIGVIVAILAYAIVAFITGAFAPPKK